MATLSLEVSEPLAAAPSDLPLDDYAMSQLVRGGPREISDQVAAMTECADNPDPAVLRMLAQRLCGCAAALELVA